MSGISSVTFDPGMKITNGFFLCKYVHLAILKFKKNEKVKSIFDRFSYWILEGQYFCQGDELSS